MFRLFCVYFQIFFLTSLVVLCLLLSLCRVLCLVGVLRLFAIFLWSNWIFCWSVVG